MTGSKTSLVSLSDVFGVGRVAESRAASRLVKAITSGTGRLLGPWLLKREFKTHLELQRLAEESLGRDLNAEITLDDRSRIVLTTNRLLHQRNRESVASKAVLELQAEPVEALDCELEIEPDWVSHFWRHAENVSDDDMQGIWARVLSGKASGKNYSARTLDLLRTLSRDEAELIERLAAFKVAIGPDHPYWRNSIGIVLNPKCVLPQEPELTPERIIVKGGRALRADEVERDDTIRKIVGNPLTNVFGPLGLYVESGFAHTFALNWDERPLPVQIGSHMFNLMGLNGGPNDGYGYFQFGEGIGFSQTGWEIFSLAKVPPHPEYLEILRAEFASKGLILEAAQPA